MEEEEERGQARRQGRHACSAPTGVPTKRPGKTLREVQLGGCLAFSPPSAPTFFSGDSGSPVLSRGVLSPRFPPPGPRARSSVLKLGLEGRRKRQPPEAQPSAGWAGPGRGSASPCPAGGVLGAAGPLPKLAHSPCPISLPRAPERAAASAGLPPRSGDETLRHRSERGSQLERETGRGWTGTELEFPSPRASGLWGPAGEAPGPSVPIPTARVPLRKSPARPSRTGGEEGRVPALRGPEGRIPVAAAEMEMRGATRRTGSAACPRCGLTFHSRALFCVST